MGFDLIAASEWESTLNLTLVILKVAAGLGFVIFVHELGHFLVAKACGVKCEKFYIGFDIPMPFGIPSRFCRFQWGETEYGIGVLPLGGYVKMLGQDDNPMNAEEEAERTRVRAPVAATTAGASLEARPVAMPAPSANQLAGIPARPTPGKGCELDPRSYTAKAVWQRMLIISAGVVMNLIFAVIFAAFAYRAGVPFMPCEIGQVVPGGPAWKAGVRPRTRIVQIGEDGTKRDTLRFDFDLRQSVYTHGDSSDLALLLRDGQGREEWKHVRPFTIREGLQSMTSIGIVNASSLKLHPLEPVQEGSAAAAASPKLTGKDTVIAVDGQPVRDSFELHTYLARYPDRAITLRVERAAEKNAPPQTLEVVLPPQRLHNVGLVMRYGPITAVKPDSPASKAGLREGDRIVAINSAPLVDAMLLPEVLRPLYGQEIEITVERPGESSPLVVKAALQPPASYEWTILYGGSMASDALGVAYEVTRQVRDVVPGSPADQADFRPGDIVTGMEFAWEEQKPDRKPRRSHGVAIKFDDRQTTWPRCFYELQQMVPGEVVKLTYEREGKQTRVALKPAEIEGFNPDRGLVFDARSEIHQAQTWNEAIHLGARQTWEDAFRVADILKKLVTGRVSVANLGGIGSIAYVAGSEASRGTTRLLIFLTMLSANLAVLNFLPIPALDGGHMMFLMYEGIFRKPVNERLQYVLTIAGVLCLLGLMIFVNAMDIKRFLFF